MVALTISGEIVLYKDGEKAITLTRETPLPISKDAAAAIVAWCCADAEEGES